MSEIWSQDVNSKDSELAQALADIDSCFALKGKRLTQDPKSFVTRHTLDGQVFYRKCYVKSGKYLRKYLGRSRVRAEWENLQFFQQIGVRTPKILAYGERKKGLMFERGALVTAEVSGAVDLESLARDKQSVLYEPHAFRVICQQVAEFTRRLHDNRFAHNDLDWRNILVVPETLEVYFFDCPAGQRWCWPFLNYRKMKDLAHLDKIARDCLPLRWRLRFYRAYLQGRKMQRADRKRLQQIARYYDGRD